MIKRTNIFYPIRFTIRNDVCFFPLDISLVSENYVMVNSFNTPMDEPELSCCMGFEISRMNRIAVCFGPLFDDHINSVYKFILNEKDKKFNN